MNQSKNLSKPADGINSNKKRSSRHHLSTVGAHFGVRGEARTVVGLLQAINSVHRFVSSSRARFALAALCHCWNSRVLLLFCSTLFLTACANHSNDLVPDQNKVGMTVSAVGHYGSMIGIPQYSIDGFHGGNNSGWGGGGSTSCCVLLPRTVTKPMFVTVKWETYRSNVDEDLLHEATVPIHFAVPPGKSSGLYVHFLPGHKVEVWVTRGYPESSEYPGPNFPFGPARPYAPLPEEKP